MKMTSFITHSKLFVMEISKNFGDIGKFGDIGTESILANNGEIA
jgi:hypothetical protein